MTVIDYEDGEAISFVGSAGVKFEAAGEDDGLARMVFDDGLMLVEPRAAIRGSGAAPSIRSGYKPRSYHFPASAPDASFIGIARDEQTAQPDLYYTRFPEVMPPRALIIDPMLATAGTAMPLSQNC